MNAFLKKLDNFWYHHKWKVLLGAFFGVTIIIMVAQFVTKPNYDLYIMYAGPRHLSANEVSTIESALDKVVDEDTNGDGLSNAELYGLFVMTDEQVRAARDGTLTGTVEYPNTAELAENQKQFSIQVMSGESVLLLLDPAEYETVKKNEGLRPLSELLDTVPEKANDEYSIRLADTTFGEYFELSKILPENTLLCFRQPSSLSFLKSKEKEEERYAFNERVFRALIDYTPPKK